MPKLKRIAGCGRFEDTTVARHEIGEMGYRVKGDAMEVLMVDEDTLPPVGPAPWESPTTRTGLPPDAHTFATTKINVVFGGVPIARRSRGYKRSVRRLGTAGVW